MSENPASNIRHPASGTATKALIIPAAGSGKRMGLETPKPFLQLAGRAILAHTLRRFLPLEGLEQIIVATSGNFVADVQQILEKTVPENIAAITVEGGKERQHSIQNALNRLADVDLVMVHDAVRPFVELSHIEKCCQVAAKNGGAVLGMPVKDTIKRVDDKQIIQETPDRTFLWQTQTPQIFKKQLIVDAYKKALKENFVGTDDASLVERLGYKIKMVEGDGRNFKITYPVDLELARLLIEKEQQ